MKFTIDELLAKLPLPASEKWPEGVWAANAFTRGNFELELFAPRGRDHQTPHEQDEFYIIVEGRADLIKVGEIIECRAGDAVFVPAGEEHHFENISPDFVTWVIFF